MEGRHPAQNHGSLVVKMVVEFRLLGTVEARADDRPVDVGHARQRCVLATLLIEIKGAVTLDELVDHVWADRPPQRARNVLYAYLSRLRTTLAAALGVALVRRSGGYAIAVDPMTVDLHRFQHLVAEAQTVNDGARAMALFDQALTLWRGEAFSTLDTPWLNAVRSRLDAQRLSAQLDRNDLALAAGRQTAMLDGLLASAAEHPLDERVIGQLMLALYRCGRQADALGEYERVRRRLADELGIDPGVSLQRIHKRILTVDAALATPGFTQSQALMDTRAPQQLPGTRSPQPAEPLPAVWNVPLRIPRFVGRDGLLIRLREQLCSTTAAPAQALHGIGGVGKTALSAEYAHRFAGAYDLVWWINAERPALIGDQIAALATAAGWIDSGADIQTAAAVVTRRLHAKDNWLIIFDSAEAPRDLHGWIPFDRGHVLITSRNPAWTELADLTEIDVLARAESAALLHDRLPWLANHEVDTIASALGDLPLAVVQAAGLLAQTRMTVAEYLAELADHAALLLDETPQVSYPTSLAAALEVSVRRLAAEDPAGLQLLQICAWFAPEPVPLAWFTATGSGVLDGPLGTIAASRSFRRTLGRLARYGLARISSNTVQLHRLTQAWLRDRADPSQRSEDRMRAERLLAAARFDNVATMDRASWGPWAAILPHLLTLDPRHTGTADLRAAAASAAFYLYLRGEYRTVLDLAGRWYQSWCATHGADDEHVLSLTNQLANAHAGLGQYAVARGLHEDTLARRQRILGADHRDTLVSKANLAIALCKLGQLQAARDLHTEVLPRLQEILGEDHVITLRVSDSLASTLRESGQLPEALALHEETLTRQRRIHGEDHLFTLASANNLATDLRLQGQIQAARELDEDTLTRQRRSLGDDHPATLRTASNLATDLRLLGQIQAAHQLDEETLTRQQRLLGDGHPATLDTASNLATDLRLLGRIQAARQLDEDTEARKRRLRGDDHPATVHPVSSLVTDPVTSETTLNGGLEVHRGIFNQAEAAVGSAGPRVRRRDSRVQ